MSINRLYNLCVILLALFAAQKLQAQDDKKGINTKYKTPTKIIEYIVGDWRSSRVLKGNKDVTANDTLALGQTITFDREGKYSMRSNDQETDKGSYRLNEEHSILYLQSEGGSDVREWNVAFSKSGAMSIWSRDRSGKEAVLKYVYTRNIQ